VGKSQPQVSEIMNSDKRPHQASNIDVLHRHASAFGMPLHCRLVFLGITAAQVEREAERIERREDLRRRELLRAALALSATGAAEWHNFSSKMIARMTDRDYLKWFAWELHLRGTCSARVESLPPELTEWAVAEASLPVPGFVHYGEDRELRLIDDSLKDLLVAQTLSSDLILGEPHRFAVVQTSHATDRLLQQFVRTDASYSRQLQSWMEVAPDPVLRVNSAGVLAKISDSESAEASVAHLRDNQGRGAFMQRR
jgi:hypothetical protein